MRMVTGLLLAGILIGADVEVSFARGGGSGHGQPQPIGMNYASDHWRNSLELFLPEQGCQPYPLAIFIHGGGWLAGDSTAVQPYLSDLLGRGFAVASLNYRFSYHAPYPAQIHDCKGAVRFLRSVADQYNLNPNRFVAFGESAGGHLASLLGTTAGVSSLEGSVGGNLSHSSAVLAVGDVYGPTDMFELGAIHNAPDSFVSRLFQWPIQDIIDNQNNPQYAQLVALVHSANPANYASPGDAAFFIIHGANDTFVPPSQSQLLHEALSGAGVQTSLTLVQGAGHDLSATQLQGLFNFLKQKAGTRAADTNCDGVVNVADLLAVIQSWGPCNDCAADITGDGVVNVADLLAVITEWG